ncbi:hypothetical protein ACWN8V_02220 [Vagococcus elongatus]|uniref:Uncharacterized protein n=1 Tax=Vagococcus elongatus TaxID=180344 RepID=A0A430B4C0_9ENTE|nr:hypothetical protein [Vagococcus elongatus]RSU15139.1 hypothetical protein CBF29_02060 [Vagococcus elongatus]
MTWYEIILIILILGTVISLWYQMYKMIELDAENRGLKHPKFWAIFSAGGQNGSGLLLYLIGRRKYPLNMGTYNQELMERRKKTTLSFFGALLIMGLLLIANFIFIRG